VRVVKAAGSSRLGSRGTDTGVHSAFSVQHQHFAFTTGWTQEKTAAGSEGEHGCGWPHTEAASCCPVGAGQSSDQ